MPELPEVETITQDLKKVLVNRTIKEVNVYDHRVLLNEAPIKFIKKVKGKKIVSIKRRGKAVVIELSPKLNIAIQLKMTGQLIYAKNDLKKSANCKETKLSFELSNGYFLNYNDQRIFGKFILAEDLERVPYFKRLGVEPLGNSFTFSRLEEGIRSRKIPVKNFLMDQSSIAGIGNIYASEILFSSRINPLKKTSELTNEEIQRLFASTVDILNDAVKHRGTSFRDYRDGAGNKGNFLSRLKVYSREKEDCLICRGKIARIVQAGRSTFFCKDCQRG
ncbi:MAG: bifunctional DNA-formamidopyrimidine glycosylase/DNA-(apurinic or apyrimidinic site) lyase [Candidatus Omnitrophica bacterium]|nr:bifunctional DNA-formamidopyrimidine glycosylase/DNA-(apurinic or apyrimidinic site) lyase [Candidatus Omnitrophota bacterium]